VRVPCWLALSSASVTPSRPCHVSSPRRVERSMRISSHCAHLFASPQGIWDLSCRDGFQRWPYNELCGKVGDGVNQAADLISATASIPSLNFIPLTTFGNWFWPCNRRQVLDAAITSLNTM